MATLAECFDNPRVFTGVVKIRKGLTARLLIDSKSIDGVHLWFHQLAKRVIERCPEDDPSRQKVLAAAEEGVRLTAAGAAPRLRTAMLYRMTALVAVGAMAWHAFGAEMYASYMGNQ